LAARGGGGDTEGGGRGSKKRVDNETEINWIDQRERERERERERGGWVKKGEYKEGKKWLKAKRGI